jgi:hypothetical protein
MSLGAPDLDVLATQLTAILDGPLRSQATAKEEGRKQVSGLITQQRSVSALVADMTRPGAHHPGRSPSGCRLFERRCAAASTGELAPELYR